MEKYVFELPDLNELQEQLDRAHNKATRMPRFTGDVDALLKAWFERAQPAYSASAKSYKRRFDRLGDIGDRLQENLRFWNTWWLSKELDRVRLAKGKIRDKYRELQDERVRAFSLYSTEKTVTAAEFIADSRLIVNFIDSTEKLRHTLEEARKRLEPHLTEYGASALGICWRSSRVSESTSYTLETFEKDVETVSAFTKDALPIRVSQAALARNAKETLRRTLALNSGNHSDGSQFPLFSTASTTTLRIALRDSAPLISGSAAHALNEALQYAQAPANFHRASAWLVFWTSMAANLRYYDKTFGSLTSENISGATWCDEWERQIGGLDKHICKAFNLPKDAIHLIRGNFQNLAAETATGADVLLALSVRELGQTRVRLAFVQFKREDGNGRAIDVWQKGLRQFNHLARLHQPSAGSSSMHALLTTRHSGLAAVPAVDCPTTRAAINSALGRPPCDDTSSWKEANCKVDWQQNGQSFCTLLMDALCNDAYGSFADAKGAFDWLSGLTKLDPTQVPRYMLFQAVGENARSYAIALQYEAKRWAKSLGLKLEDRSRDHSHRMPR